MNSHSRTTRECSLDQLHANLSKALREYFQTQQLGDLEAEIRLCCETIVENHTSGKLASFLEGDPDTVFYLALLLTPDWLIWARNGDRSGTSINRAKIKGLQVKTYVTKRNQNMQLEVLGRISDSRDYVRGILELGPERAAQKFCEEVVSAVQSVTPTARKGRFRWFGS